MKYGNTTKGCLLAVVITALTATAASGESAWVNPFGGVFNIAANWSPAAVPGAGTGIGFGLSDPGYTVTFDISRMSTTCAIYNDNVTFDLAGYTYLMSAGLWVGYGANIAAVLTLKNGSVESTGGYLASGYGSRGSLTVPGGVWWKNNSYLVVGETGAGQLTVSGGGTATGSTTVTLGSSTWASGTVVVDGLNSLWTMSQTLTIGSNGSGGLFVRNGGRVQTGLSSTIAGAAGVASSAVVDGAGSQWTHGSTLTVGVYGAGSMAIRNGGLVSNTAAIIGASAGATGDVTVDGAGSTWTNSSDLYVGSAAMGTLTVTNGGRVNSANGYVGYTSAVPSTVTLGSGGTWTCTGKLDVGKSGAGNVAVNSGGRLSCAGATIGTDAGGAGSVVVDSPGAMWTATGDLDVGSNGSGRLIISGGASASCGAAYVGRNAGSSGEVYVTGSGSLWKINGNLYLGGDSAKDNASPASLTIGSGSTVRVGGPTVQVWSGGSLLLDGGTLAYTFPTPTIANSGLIEGHGRIAAALNNSPTGRVSVTQPGDHLTFASPSGTHQNAGEIALAGGIIEFQKALTNTSTGFISGQGTIIAGGGLTNQGVVVFSGGQADFYGDITNAAGAKIVLTGGSTTTFYDDVNATGGEIRVGAACAVVFLGTYNGGTTGAGTVYIEGDLRPGHSPGAVTFEGDLVLGSGAALVAELAGAMPGSQYDVLDVGGQLALGGTLDVELLYGFRPQPGQMFDILDFDPENLSGRFSAFDLPDLGGGLSWDTSNLYTTGSIGVVPEPATLALLGFGAAGLVARRFRRK
jgi:T5SS/PEP-CTERM-associated repeat protein